MKPYELSNYMATIGRKGGYARANKLTKEELSAIAKKAVQARENKRKLNEKA